MAAADQDWREFRARLVERERQEGGLGDRGNEREQKGWAYAMPLIEQGSVLLSAPGDHFALQQQYFHKAVILIVRHTDQGDMGLILNRPTAFSAGDLDLPFEDPFPDRILKFVGLPTGSDAWNVWFGGDCHGLGTTAGNSDMVCSCLHTSERLAVDSEEVIKGVYMIELERARELVASGVAEQDEFLLLTGYCGWGPGQLQEELDRKGSWIMVAADQRALLGKLRQAQASLTSRLERARTRQALPGGSKVTVADVGDGIMDWQRLFEALEAQSGASQWEGMAEPDGQADNMLRRWVEQRLLPHSAPFQLPGVPAQGPPSRRASRPLHAGAVLRGSPTQWLLGAPPELMQEGTWRMRPAQYLHKAVLLLLQDSDPNRPSSLAILDGPKIGVLSDGAGDVFFGGPEPTPPDAGGLLAVPGGGVWGRIELPPGLLEMLVAVGALDVAEDSLLSDATAVPAPERWAAVGGTISTIGEALTAAQGDAQRKRWYKSYLGLDVDADR